MTGGPPTVRYCAPNTHPSRVKDSANRARARYCRTCVTMLRCASVSEGCRRSTRGLGPPSPSLRMPMNAPNFVDSRCSRRTALRMVRSTGSARGRKEAPDCRRVDASVGPRLFAAGTREMRAFHRFYREGEVGFKRVKLAGRDTRSAGNEGTATPKAPHGRSILGLRHRPRPSRGACRRPARAAPVRGDAPAETRPATRPARLRCLTDTLAPTTEPHTREGTGASFAWGHDNVDQDVIIGCESGRRTPPPHVPAPGHPEPAVQSPAPSVPGPGRRDRGETGRWGNSRSTAV